MKIDKKTDFLLQKDENNENTKCLPFGTMVQKLEKRVLNIFDLLVEKEVLFSSNGTFFKKEIYWILQFSVGVAFEAAAALILKPEIGLHW